jgi:hypothetical protein
MDEREKLEEKLKTDISLADDYFEKTSKYVKTIPSIQKWKEGKETSLRIIQKLPKDVADELAPRLLAWEEENDKAIDSNFPVLPDIPPAFIHTVESSSGSATPYIVNATNILMSSESYIGQDTDWIDEITSTISEHTLKKQKENYLPIRLEKINPHLGEMYKIANDNVIKSQNKIIGIDQSVIQMRDVLEQVWGGLVKMAREKNINPTINMNRLEFKKAGDRDLVATLLSTALFPKLKISELLSDAYFLHQNLSDRNFGKNPLTKETDKLILYYQQWNAILDGISGIVV